MWDMREVKQLNEKIMKICKLVIDNLEEQEINTHSIESNENKSHETEHIYSILLPVVFIWIVFQFDR
jgi:hypothetical protein